MGWMEYLKAKAKNFWGSDARQAITSYSYTTMLFGLKQVSAIPNYVAGLVEHKPTRVVAGHLIRIAVEDVIPMVLVTYTNDLVQSYGRSYQEKNNEDNYYSQLILQSSLILLQTATKIFKHRQQAKILVRTAIITLEAPTLAHQLRASNLSTVCIDEKCSTLRFMQGNVRDLVAYYSTEAILSGFYYIPLIGSTIYHPLSIYHRGRYVLTVVLPELCNRHQTSYLRDYSELALSIGLIHFAMSSFANSLIENRTGIPSGHYGFIMEQLLLLVLMNITALCDLPTARKHSSRKLLDPILMYQAGIGFVFDVFVLGLKVKIPRMLSNKDPLAFSNRLMSLPFTYWADLLANALGYRVTAVFLPSLLIDLNVFLNDPIVNNNWRSIHKKLCETLLALEDLNEYFLLRVSSSTPGLTSALVEKFFGTPEFINKVLLKLLTDKKFIKGIKDFRLKIKSFQREEINCIAVSEDTLLIDRKEITEAREVVSEIKYKPPVVVANWYSFSREMQREGEKAKENKQDVSPNGQLGQKM